jgi:hypothetical protein
VDVTCRDFQDRITAAVDKFIAGEEMNLFLDHANRCPACRHDYEQELTTKLVVKNRARMVPMPGSVRASILRMVNGEGQPPAARLPSWWEKVSHARLGKPALAFALASTVFLIILRVVPLPPPTRQLFLSSSDDMMQQSFTNFQSVASGSIQPQVVSEQPDRVREFFAGKTDFPVLLPTMSRCTLVGGAMNDYKGVTLAHVVYKYENGIVYMCQTCWTTVQEGEHLRLREEVRASLQRTGWYTESRPDGNSIALWTNGSTLCAAVARMSTDDLRACLTSGPRAGRDAW